MGKKETVLKLGIETSKRSRLLQRKRSPPCSLLVRPVDFPKTKRSRFITHCESRNVVVILHLTNEFRCYIE